MARPIGVNDAAAAVSLTVPASSTFWPALLAKVLALAGLLLAGFPASAAPSIGSVQITPDAITAGAPTTVRVTAVIADPTLIPATVNLQRVNEAGAAVAVLGSLHDDGRNGDAVAGDQVYTLDVVLTETSPLRLRVSAGFQGMVKRVFSAEVLLPINRPPLADAGPDQSVARGKRVSLDGSASRDPEGATLSHTWSLIDRPAGSAATLTDANRVRPTFTADVPGQYIAQLIVRDGPLASAPDTVRITVTDPGLTILYLHADHLGTPRVATNEANVVVWRNLPISEPFGMALPEEDPDGDGQPTIINLRFPGQYFDRETQLHYNYYRDYDPGVGRYVQSDPIGLEGGVNTYLYTLGNPLKYSDAKGLDVYMDIANRRAGLQPDIPPNKYACFIMCFAAKTAIGLGIVGKGGKAVARYMASSLEAPATGGTISWLTGSKPSATIGEILGITVCWEECSDAACKPR
ncbi:RHS repeat-associated core domain-containing protein [Candidatus Accumulibacter contiguus]|uniref:RHS repeat-associated core domain-containing protein n=1 Tax=Candidatus Accumulibacter contiguus TaxID=2954381 RepID=UPI002FC395DD